MSEPGHDPNKKHRHDVGHPDHGAVATEGITRAIQGLMLLLIAGSAALAIVAIALASR
ncbi:MAG TPA: hypothetical protein VK698_26170 [Kofleriaceae bacterium]|nr:hypothetical protein [Kofleriaceae bacterium]